MSRSLTLVPLALVAALVAVPPRTHGCAVVPRPGGQIGISSENALIVYDSATKTEHFIRTASFTASASADFGFLVPTPSKPELHEASPDVFAALAEITKPRTVVERRPRPINFGCLLGESKVAEFSTVGAAFPAPKADVSVVERKRVGAFDAAVLQADDPKKLREWLATNGYDARPQLEEWFQAYTATGWFLTAFKIAADDGQTPAGAKTVNNSAVRISFQTDTPFYPYREPADARGETAAQTSRTLRLFVLSDSRVSGTIGKGDGATPFPGRTVWANKAEAGRLSATASSGKLPESLGQRDWHLTEFEDRSSPRPGTDEVYFAAAADQSAVERPPHVIVEYYDPPLWPYFVTMVGCPVLLLIGGLLLWRAVAKRGRNVQ